MTADLPQRVPGQSLGWTGDIGPPTDGWFGTSDVSRTRDAMPKTDDHIDHELMQRVLDGLRSLPAADLDAHGRSCWNSRRPSNCPAWPRRHHSVELNALRSGPASAQRDSPSGCSSGKESRRGAGFTPSRAR